MNQPKEYQYVKLDEKLYRTYDDYLKAIRDIEAKLDALNPGMVTNEDLIKVRESVLKEQRKIADNRSTLYEIDSHAEKQYQSLLKRIEALNARFDSETGLQMYYYLNEAPYAVTSGDNTVMAMTISTNDTTNVICDFLFTGTASEECELTIKLLMNQKPLTYQPVFHLMPGINTIGFPYGIPKVMLGSTMFSASLSCSSGEFKINPYNFQATFTGSQMIGGISSQIPYAQVEDTISYADFLQPFDGQVVDEAEIFLSTPLQNVMADRTDYSQFAPFSEKLHETHWLMLASVLPANDFEKLNCNNDALQISADVLSIKDANERSIETVEFLTECKTQEETVFYNIRYNGTLNQGDIRFLISCDDDPAYYGISNDNELTQDTTYMDAGTIDTIATYLQTHPTIKKLRIKCYLIGNATLKSLEVGQAFI